MTEDEYKNSDYVRWTMLFVLFLVEIGVPESVVWTMLTGYHTWFKKDHSRQINHLIDYGWETVKDLNSK